MYRKKIITAAITGLFGVILCFVPTAAAAGIASPRTDGDIDCQPIAVSVEQVSGYRIKTVGHLMCDTSGYLSLTVGAQRYQSGKWAGYGTPTTVKKFNNYVEATDYEACPGGHESVTVRAKVTATWGLSGVTHSGKDTSYSTTLPCYQ